MNPPDALPPVPPQVVASPRNAAAVEALAQAARADLARLNFPPANWSLPAKAPDGTHVLDVLIAGAGMCGQTAAFALMREGVTNIQVIDRAPRGDEGPWGTYARMVTLRSPKHVTGPDLGIPSLSFRAWFEAQHGEAGWAGLHKVGRIDWRDYLLWVRDTAGLPVRNVTSLLTVDTEDGLVKARVKTVAGEQTWWARRLVLALGREGSGSPRWPSFPSLDLQQPGVRSRVFHSTDTIDFDAMRGKRVGVLGAGASGFENAASALEAGAQVALFARRRMLPQVNTIKWTAFPGFMRGFEALDDARKWRFYTYIAEQQVPPPWESVRRCDGHATFSLHLGVRWDDVVVDADGVTVKTSGGTERFDSVIFCTGFDVDLFDRPEIARYVPYVDTWARHVSAAEAAAHPGSARFPYLGPGFELLPTDPAYADAFSRIHLFNWGSTMSHGALAGEIPGLAIGATRLANAIARALFLSDADRHWAALQSHSEPELLATRWYVPPAGEKG